MMLGGATSAAAILSYKGILIVQSNQRLLARIAGGILWGCSFFLFLAWLIFVAAGVSKVLYSDGALCSIFSTCLYLFHAHGTWFQTSIATCVHDIEKVRLCSTCCCRGKRQPMSPSKPPPTECWSIPLMHMHTRIGKWCMNYLQSYHFSILLQESFHFVLHPSSQPSDSPALYSTIFRSPFRYLSN